MPFPPNDAFRFAFGTSAACLAIAILISSLEYLSLRREFRSDGMFSWDVFGHKPFAVSSLTRLRNAILGAQGSVVVLFIRIAAGLGLLFNVVHLDARVCFPCLALIMATEILLLYRNPFPLEGADQMCIIVAAGLLVAMVNQSLLTWHILGFGFISAQVCLAYLTAGVTKALSPVWRDGTALYKIMNTATFGHLAGARLLRGRRAVGLALCWTIIVFEVLFPLTLVLPSKWLILFFIVGILFHVGNALLMGLNIFVWAYAATYPAVWFCQLHLRHWLAAHG
jgi:hypothetical protein